MGFTPTLEERIALLETVVMPALAVAAPGATITDHCHVPECEHYYDDESDYDDYPYDYVSPTEAPSFGDQASPLRGKIESAISEAVDRLSVIVEDGDPEEVLAASDQLFGFLIALRGGASE